MKKLIFFSYVLLASIMMCFLASATMAGSNESYQFVVRSHNVTPGRFAHVNAPAFHEMQGILESTVSLAGATAPLGAPGGLKKLHTGPGTLFEKFFKSLLCSRHEVSARFSETEASDLFLDHLVLLI